MVLFEIEDRSNQFLASVQWNGEWVIVWPGNLQGINYELWNRWYRHKYRAYESTLSTKDRHGLQKFQIPNEHGLVRADHARK